MNGFGKQKLYFALVCVFLLCLLCACGNGGSGEQPTATPTATPTEQEGTLPTPTDGTTILPEAPEKQPAVSETGIWVYFCVNSSAAGKISGKTTQELTDGSKTTTVTAQANPGYRFVRWSDGATDAIRQRESFDTTSVITAIFDYEAYQLPIVVLTTETGEDVTSKTEYIGGTIGIVNAGSLNLATTADGIRGRGNNTWTYEKKSYKLHFDEKISLLNVGKASKTWILMANVCDQSLLRNQTALKLISLFD